MNGWSKDSKRGLSCWRRFFANSEPWMLFASVGCCDLTTTLDCSSHHDPREAACLLACQSVQASDATASGVVSHFDADDLTNAYGGSGRGGK